MLDESTRGGAQVPGATATAIPTGPSDASRDVAVVDAPIDSPFVVRDSGSETGPADSAAETSTPTDSGSDARAEAGFPGCGNGFKDGFETDIDCGGSQCPKCADTLVCSTGVDCESSFCNPSTFRCAAPTCTDGFKNGNESDVDCGGSCPKCSPGKLCTSPLDCTQNVCDTFGTCGCPPKMVVVAVSSPLGGGYCVDQTEVTKGDYRLFVNSGPSLSAQIQQCQTNGSFTPTGGWPPSQPLSSSMGLPVTNVDWCDAFAYCAWSGKRLCGRVGGGSLGGSLSDANDYTKSSWFNACSAQNTFAFPYGTQARQAGQCNDSASGTWMVQEWTDQGTYTGIPVPLRRCQGGSVDLYQMSGNVAEWEDACSGTSPGDTCRLRGGSYAAGGNGSALSCLADRTLVRTQTADDVGFRCCAY